MTHYEIPTWRHVERAVMHLVFDGHDAVRTEIAALNDQLQEDPLGSDWRVAAKAADRLMALAKIVELVVEDRPDDERED